MPVGQGVGASLALRHVVDDEEEGADGEHHAGRPLGMESVLLKDKQGLVFPAVFNGNEDRGTGMPWEPFSERE